MNEYKINLKGYYEKTVTVCADTAEQAAEKLKTALFDTDLIQFTDEDFIGGDVEILDTDEDNDEDECSGCECCCPICGNCIYACEC